MVQGVFATDMRYHQTHCERLRAMIDSAADHQVVMGRDPTAPAAAAARAGPLLASLAWYCPPPPPSYLSPYRSPYCMPVAPRV